MKIINSKYNSKHLYDVYENRKRTILDKLEQFGPSKTVVTGIAITAIGTLFFVSKMGQNLPIVRFIALMAILLIGALLLMAGCMLLCFGGAAELYPKFSFMLDVADLLAFCEDASEENLEVLRYEDGLLAIENGGPGEAEFVDMLYMDKWLQKAFKEDTLDLSVFDKNLDKAISTRNTAK